MFNRRLLGLIASLLALAGCAKPEPARPALWQVDGPGGERAWLFGTIHALPEPVEWRSPLIEASLAQSDRLIVEVAAVGDDAAIARTFAQLANSPGMAPLEMRIDPSDRGELQLDLDTAGLAAGSLDGMETWAAALALQQGLSAKSGNDNRHGIDRALASSYRGPIEEFEGARAQLAIFDRLAESDQRDLLLAVLRGGDPREESRRLAQAWSQGNVELIAEALSGEMLSDPELRDALLVGRNRAWVAQLEARLKARAKPFVAVGAAHLAGPEGLPAMLNARGYSVRRLQ